MRNPVINDLVEALLPMSIQATRRYEHMSNPPWAVLTDIKDELYVRLDMRNMEYILGLSQPPGSVFVEPVPSQERRTLILTVESKAAHHRSVNLFTEASLLAGLIGRTLSLIDKAESFVDFEEKSLMETVIEVRVTPDVSDPSAWIHGPRYMMWQLLDGKSCDVVQNALVTDVHFGTPSDYVSKLYFGGQPGPVLDGWPILVVLRSFAESRGHVGSFNMNHITNLDFSEEYSVVVQRELKSIKGDLE